MFQSFSGLQPREKHKSSSVACLGFVESRFSKLQNSEHKLYFHAGIHSTVRCGPVQFGAVQCRVVIYKRGEVGEGSILQITFAYIK